MNRIFLLGMIFCFNFAYAVEKNVSIQCRPEGPIYAGKIEFPSKLSDWTLTQINPNTCLVSTRVPIRIEFNGVEYSNVAPISREDSVSPGQPKGCENRVARYGLGIAEGVYPLKSSIGYEVSAVLNRGSDKNTLEFVSFYDSGSQECRIFN
jgi:hypothetical protein